MSGVKGKSGGARNGSGRKAGVTDGRTKVQPSILPKTLENLRIYGAIERKGSAAKPAKYAAEILDKWHSSGDKISGEVKYSSELPALYDARRLQITVRVEKETAIALYSKATAEDASLSASAGKILDLWSARISALAEKRIASGVGA